MTFEGEYLIPVNTNMDQTYEDEENNKGGLTMMTNLPETAMDYYTNRDQKVEKFLNLDQIVIEDIEDPETLRKKEEEAQANRIDYGAGYRAVRLVNGQFIDIDDIPIAEITEEELDLENDY